MANMLTNCTIFLKVGPCSGFLDCELMLAINKLIFLFFAELIEDIWYNLCKFFIFINLLIYQFF